MVEDRDVPSAWLLSAEVVREAVEILTKEKIHQLFVLYLHLRRRAHQLGRFTQLDIDTDQIHDWLDVPGGPPDKPHFRPFNPTGKGQPAAFWLNRNLPGSYAPSSLRDAWRTLFMDEDGTYRLPVDETGAPDPDPIATSLLASTQIPAWAVAAFIFRNYGFGVGPEGAEPGLSALLDTFRDYFGWTPSANGKSGEEVLFDWEAEPSHSPVLVPSPDASGLEQYPLEIEAVVLYDDHPVRMLDASALGIGYEDKADRATAEPDAPLIDEHDPAIHELIEAVLHYGGAILSGPPGTSKSYRASAAAKALADYDDKRVRFTQFHQSYQFDDFIEGYRPREDETPGFERRPGVFVDFCEIAEKHPDHPHVFVIDELSRGDVGRIFGEALTYIERSRRNQHFTLPSGRTFKIPHNVYIIATMNPLDRGVDEVDAAFERRFAKIATNPDAVALEARLRENGLPENLITGVINWFNQMNGLARESPAAAVGHAYFWGVTDEDSLKKLWTYQLSHVVERAFRHDKDQETRLTATWERLFAVAPVDETAQEGDEG